MNRVAVVTGANQGLGFALAEGLGQSLASGDIVYVTGRSADALREGRGARAHGGPADAVRQPCRLSLDPPIG